MATGIAETSNSQQGPQGQGASSRTKLVQRLLGAGASLPQFLNDMLGTMAVVVAGTEAAGFLLEREAADSERVGLRPVAHIRPDESDAETRAAAITAFQEIIAPCIRQDKDGAVEVGTPDAGEPQFCLVTLLRAEGQIVAVAAVITRCRDLERARQRLLSMQLVAGYFELWTMRRSGEQNQIVARNHQDALQLVSSVGTTDGFESGAMNLCNELANRVGATRVALGWVKGRNVKVRALSHTEKFDKKQELVVQLQKVMEECADQEEPVRYDCDGERSDNVTRAAEVLSRQQGGNSVLSLPLRGKEDVWGVLTVEWAPPNKPSAQTAEALIIASSVLAPQLRDRYQNDRWLAVKVGHSIQENARLVIGPRHMLVKLIVVLVFAAAVIITFYKPMYHVSAAFRLEAEGRQTIAAPFQAKIEQLKVKLGQTVKKGDVLVVLDTQELENKKADADAQYDAKMIEYRTYLADPTKVAQAGIARAESEAAAAQSRVCKIEIEQGMLVAPFDGVIIKGDLEDKVGTVVKLGDSLMEIAPGRALRAELSISERDIQELADPIRVGLNHAQRGKLATTSFPDRDIPFTVERIIPLGNAKEGDNVFTVYARLDANPGWLRPGMQGEAKVDTEHRRVVWIWTHRLIEFLRLKLWL